MLKHNYTAPPRTAKLPNEQWHCNFQ